MVASVYKRNYMVSFPGKNILLQYRLTLLILYIVGGFYVEARHETTAGQRKFYNRGNTVVSRRIITFSVYQ